MQVGGTQCIKTPHGHVSPLAMQQSLAYLDMRPCTKCVFDELPHVVLTSDSEWDPTV